MIWKTGTVHDCIVRQLTRYTDARGWLSEIFRQDELAPEVHPAMAYVSMTHAGIARGPHEHRYQTDIFAFLSGTFRLYLWDNRSGSSTYGVRQILDIGRNNPCTVQVPPGVIHAYRNTGAYDAIVINCPNRLYAGYGREEAVDEIRWEDRTDQNLILD